VVNVPDGSDVYVRLVPLELGLSHNVLLRTPVRSPTEKFGGLPQRVA
jgi:hypothetical protein